MTIKRRLVDYNDVLEALYFLIYPIPLNWETKADQQYKIGQIRKELHHHYHKQWLREVRQGWAEERLQKLNLWIRDVKSNIKHSIEEKYCISQSQLSNLIYQRQTIETSWPLYGLWYSLVEEPIDIKFPDLTDELSDYPCYRISDGRIDYIIDEGVQAFPVSLTEQLRKVFNYLALESPKFVSNSKIYDKCWQTQSKNPSNLVSSNISAINKVFCSASKGSTGAVIENNGGYRLAIRRID